MFSGTSGSGTTLGCAITDFFSSIIVLSFPPSSLKLLGGKCLTYIGTEGYAGTDSTGEVVVSEHGYDELQMTSVFAREIVEGFGGDGAGVEDYPRYVRGRAS